MLLKVDFMEPILDRFRSQLTTHATLIKSQLRRPWKTELDKCPTTMWQADLPGNLILYCMVDTMIVLARVMPKSSFYTPVAFRSTAEYNANTIRSACTWYLPRQAGIHTQIKALLESDWSPKENSIAFLQLALMHVIESGIRSRVDNTDEGLEMLSGAARDLTRFMGSVTQDGLSTFTGITWGGVHEVRRGLFG